MSRLTAVLFTLVIPFATVSAQSVIYVDVDATGANDGLSWADAFVHLQDGLAAAASGDEIWVAEGTYYPDRGAGVTEGDPDASFVLSDNILVYGGFSGQEFVRDERDAALYTVTLSGEGGLPGFAGDDAMVVVRMIGSGPLLDGFVVTAGRQVGVNATGETALLANLLIFGNGSGVVLRPSGGGPTPDDIGGSIEIVATTVKENIGVGVQSVWGHLRMEDCDVSNNESAGVSLYGASNEIVSTTVLDNDGAGVFQDFEGTLAITDSRIAGNSKTGVRATESRVDILRSTISGNFGLDYGNGIWIERGRLSLFDTTIESNDILIENGYRGAEFTRVSLLASGLYVGTCFCSGFTATDVLFTFNSLAIIHSTRSLNRLVFVDNDVNEDAPLNVFGGIVTNSLFVGNTGLKAGAVVARESTIANSVFSGNTGVEAGAVRVSGGIITGSSFNGNTSLSGGGAATFANSGNFSYLTNSILWGNSSPGGELAESGDPNATLVQHTNIQGGIPVGVVDGGGNLDADPLFVDADGVDNTLGTEDDDLHVSATSPTIDAGVNEAIPADVADLDADGDVTEPIPFDLDGRPRIADGGGGLVVDMGAYEVRVLLARGLRVSPDEESLHITDHSPLIEWEVLDSGQQPQEKYEVQVSSVADFSTVDLWDSGEQFDVAKSATYAGTELADGETYYARVRVYSFGEYSPWSLAATFRMNSLPSVPVLRSPDLEVVVPTLTPSLISKTSTDAESDELTYDLQVSEDSLFGSLVVLPTGLVAANDSVSFAFADTLTDNHHYWWRYRADDSFETSAWSPPRSFWVNVRNDAPQAFTLVSPTGDVNVATVRPTLVFHSAIDPDPFDSVLYSIEFDSLESGVAIYETGSDTTFTFGFDLSDDTRFRWRVTATDTSGANTANDDGFTSFVVNTQNNPPTPFSLLRPASDSVLTTLMPVFEWEESSDPDLTDTLTYLVRAGLDSLLTVFLTLELDTTVVVPPEPLQDNLRYWWQVIVRDLTGAADTTETWSFWVDTGPDAPGEVVLISPENKTSQHPTTPTFSWRSAIDPDPLDTLTYNLFVGADSLLEALVVSETQLSDTTFKVAEPLGDDLAYFWRVEAVDMDSLVSSSEVWRFGVGAPVAIEGLEIPDEYKLHQNYPNPFNPTTTIKYDLPVGGRVVLTVYDVLGRRIRHTDEDNPAGYHSLTFDANGLSSGMYMYRLEVGEFTDTRSMLVLK